jgi:hypothetical protein
MPPRHGPPNHMMTVWCHLEVAAHSASLTSDARPDVILMPEWHHDGKMAPNPTAARRYLMSNTVGDRRP